jgi:hypothetical protein
MGNSQSINSNVPQTFTPFLETVIQSFGNPQLISNIISDINKSYYINNPNESIVNLLILILPIIMIDINEIGINKKFSSYSNLCQQIFKFRNINTMNTIINEFKTNNNIEYPRIDEILNADPLFREDPSLSVYESIYLLNEILKEANTSDYRFNIGRIQNIIKLLPKESLITKLMQYDPSLLKGQNIIITDRMIPLSSDNMIYVRDSNIIKESFITKCSVILLQNFITHRSNINDFLLFENIELDSSKLQQKSLQTIRSILKIDLIGINNKLKSFTKKFITPFRNNNNQLSMLIYIIENTPTTPTTNPYISS